jgi:hypothetical protein
MAALLLEITVSTSGNDCAKNYQASIYSLSGSEQGSRLDSSANL